MGSGSDQTFSCNQCGRKFIWKPELAGRKVRCKCGNTFVAELVMEAEEAPEEFDLKEDVAAPPPLREIPGKVEPAPTVLAYQASPAARPQAAQEMERSARARNIYLPIAVIVAGVGLRIVQVYLPDATSHGWLVTIALIALLMVINVLVMLAGVVIAAMFVDTDFGAWGPAALKITAISIISSAVAVAAISLDWNQRGVNGPIIALNAVILINFALFKLLFEMELQDSLLTVAIVTGFQIGASCVAFAKMK
jgi:hypothetical protein